MIFSYYLISSNEQNLNLCIFVNAKVAKKSRQEDGSQCEFFVAPILSKICKLKVTYPEFFTGLSKNSYFWRLFPLLFSIFSLTRLEILYCTDNWHEFPQDCRSIKTFASIIDYEIYLKYGMNINQVRLKTVFINSLVEFICV